MCPMVRTGHRLGGAPSRSTSKGRLQALAANPSPTAPFKESDWLPKKGPGPDQVEPTGAQKQLRGSLRSFPRTCSEQWEHWRFAQPHPEKGPRTRLQAQES